MARTLQIPNVPDAIHRQIKSKAAQEGLSLSDFLLREVRRVAGQPTMHEMLERLRGREPVRLRTSVVSILRRERSSR